MTRISSLASNTALINQILRTQRSLFEFQTQIGTQKVSQDYAGISTATRRLINLENSRDQLQQFAINNNQMNLRLEIAESAIGGITKAMDDFKDALIAFQGGDRKDPARVSDIQGNAFKSLQSIQGLLNVQADGRFVFSGAKVTSQPVDLGLTTISAFQAQFDGARVTIPTTRDAHLEDFSFSKNSSTSATNWLTFVRDQGGTGISRVTATSSEFNNVTVGSTITISGTTSGTNDGTYEVVAVSGTTIDIKTEQLTDEGALAVTISYQDPNDSKTTITLNTTTSFTRATNTITRTAGDALTNVPVGAKITIAGAAAGPPTNNGSFTVASNDGTNIVIETNRFTDQGTAGAKYFTFTSAANLNFVDGGASADTIVAPANTFKDGAGNLLLAGAQITVTGGLNNGKTFTIASVSADGSTVTLVAADVVAAVTGTTITLDIETAPGTISSTSYYKGDGISVTHRVDSDRDFEFDITGIDPAFEKGIRAMKLILQGKFKTEGGLDQNQGRISDALFLMQSSLKRNTLGTPPFGTELASNTEALELEIGFNRILIRDTNAFNENLIGFLENNIVSVEDIDLTTTLTRLLDGQIVLEASFQAFARIRQLSLTNFL